MLSYAVCSKFDSCTDFTSKIMAAFYSRSAYTPFMHTTHKNHTLQINGKLRYINHINHILHIINQKKFSLNEGLFNCT